MAVDDAVPNRARLRLRAIDIADGLAAAFIANARRLPRWCRRRGIWAGLFGLAFAGSLLTGLTIMGVATLVLEMAVVFVRPVRLTMCTLLMLPAAWISLRRNAALAQPVTYSWDGGALGGSQPGGDVVTPWAEIAGWDEGRLAFVLRRPSIGFVVMAKRDLTDAQAAQIRTLLDQAEVPRMHAPDHRTATGRAMPPMAPRDVEAEDASARRIGIVLTIDELVYARRACILRAFRRPATALTVLLFAVAIGWVLWRDLPDAYGIAASLALGATAVVFLRLVLPVALLRRQMERILRDRRELREVCWIDWDQSGFDARYANGTIRRLWPDIRRWHDTPGLILLYLSDGNFHAIPLRVMTAAQFTDLRRCAAAARVSGA